MKNEQQHLIRKMWKGLVNPVWVERFDKQLKDDMGGFRKIQGIAIDALSSDQKDHAQKVLPSLIEPYRQKDQDESLACPKKQGGLHACHLTFHKKDDFGGDGIWDNWRLEGPSFIWHYQGAPHVHVWINVADSAKVELHSQKRSGPLRKG